MAGLVPRDAPDPDGDRRFAERPFPLLEPVAWTGERHRGGYGVRDPGGTTTSLGLVFGPWDPFVSEPRLAISVGTGFPVEVTARHAPMLMRPHLAAARDQLLRRPGRDERPARRSVLIEIQGDSIEFSSLHGEDRWIARGRWAGYAVEVHAICIEPASVRLQVTTDVPER
jgi:hypothetical protein